MKVFFPFFEHEMCSWFGALREEPTVWRPELRVTLNTLFPVYTRPTIALQLKHKEEENIQACRHTTDTANESYVKQNDTNLTFF